MSEAKHTPGPWSRHGTIIALIDENNIRTKRIAEVKGGFGDGEADANAQLITAAPDMLESLKWAEDELASYAPDPACRSKITDDILSKIRATIAKAEGRS